jgi:hypothetical protein
MARSLGLVVVVVTFIVACAAEPVPSTVDLPGPTSPPTECAGVGGDVAILRGDPNDARLTWETARDGSGRQYVVWPPGYRARFAPSLEVFDPAGRVIARDGDLVPGVGCVVDFRDDSHTLLLVLPEEWPALRRLDSPGPNGSGELTP